MNVRKIITGLSMPTYEFRCLDCHKRFDIFLSFSEYENAQVKCPHCDSKNIQRKIGRIRVARSDDSRLENFSDTDLNGMENDPQGMGRMMRKMSQEAGEEMPAEFDEVIGRLEKGESPETIEKSMPDLGAGMNDTDNEF
jgi:putative FmdB family regulatory protein